MFGIFANPMRFGNPLLYPSSFGFVQPFFRPMKRGFNSHSFLPPILQSQFERNNYGLFDDLLFGNIFNDLDVFPEKPSLLKDIDNNNNNKIKHNTNDDNNVPKKQPRIYEHHKRTVCDSNTGITKETEIERIDNKWAEKNIILDKEGKKSESIQHHEDDQENYEKVIQQFKTLKSYLHLNHFLNICSKISSKQLFPQIL